MRLSAHLVEKPWGVDKLPAFLDVNDGRRIGELWFKGPEGSEMPLLVKYIFTSEKLSVQVHPDDRDARARGMPFGKSECWYILSAEEGATLGIGTRRALSDDELRAAAEDGTIEELMNWYPVKPGDYVFIPPGTVHAIGSGIGLVEVQRNVDCTYRLYDYGRPRELHLDDGVAVACARPHDRANRVHVADDDNISLPTEGAFRLWHWRGALDLSATKRKGPLFCVPLSEGVHVDGIALPRGACAMIDDPAAIDVTSEGRMLLAGASD